ncbi:MAG: Spy/CpxP family protein refolding chaperone [Microcystis sp. M038S2]|uniref:Spy/CpxP family protein refolding chaperone n=1 Tax=unclassified Microcystis TaxID=2643300 RepID=UPI0011962BA1|nr:MULTISPECIES: Spy/CpxP family protein refolding chaperone [unclassified Microcystis]NCS12686.1 Spy/CpxP family protein refolding chaperone [Microcystis aeruginosa G13-09]NCS38732.1 Spy/CpxP family protein refolding chaperone [Microcystis aeruginosa BS13-10]TRU56018.1 MAG: periplasmic heavy metal sensor [Microcystis aeruginosa Ma_QC_C_20070823_S13D]TRU67492.1 MAG: periplasmic heavy metal sensor [Microcystis aeruginosa Ma_QC_C_20070823_S13]MCA2682966.1 Spy/CpxP family protein refolding chaper
MSLSTLSIFGTTMALTLAVNLAPTATVLSYPQDRLFIAQTSSPQRPESRPRRVNNSREGLIEQLNLTDDQKSKVAAIRQKYRGQIQKLQETIRNNEQELNSLLSNNASDRDIRSKHQQISRNRQEISNLQFENFLEIRQVLTPAQRMEFSQLMQERCPNFPNCGRP